MNATRGYCGIGIVGCKIPENTGTLWRTAHALDVDFLFVVGPRYRRQPSDTSAAERHVPLWCFPDLHALRQAIPMAALVGVELDERAELLAGFQHPEAAVYVLGAEDRGLSDNERDLCDALVQLPGSHCLNVAVAGSIVLYNRMTRGMR